MSNDPHALALLRRALRSDERLLQIRRAHRSARPTERNPAWLHTHRDLDYVLSMLESLGLIERL